MYEKEILEELKRLNQRMEKNEDLLLNSRDFGGQKFPECLSRIALNTDAPF